MKDLLANQTVFQCWVLLPTLHHHKKTSFLTAFSKCWENRKTNKPQTKVRKMSTGKQIFLGEYYSV